jgi:hypothetical protein
VDPIVEQGREPVIPSRNHRKLGHCQDASPTSSPGDRRLLRQALKQRRRIAPLYDKLAADLLGFTNLARILI